MKRLLLLAGMILLLGACGNDDPEEDVMSQVDDQSDDAEDNSTDDPMEVATNDYEYFTGNTDDFKVTRYSSDEANEDGLIEIDENGYNFKFNVLYGESESGEDKVLIVGEQINNNDDGGKMIWYPGDLILDGEEKIDSGFGFDAVDPGIKSKVVIEYDVEYGTPNEIVIEGGRIDESDEEAYDDEQPDPIELDKTFTFTKE